jgi:glycosyltransferase involved in cell wall biosynthesis
MDDPELNPLPDALPDVPYPPPLLLSVIIPVRNEQESLPACLDSLLAQSEPGFAIGDEWEILLVDDGSTDRTPEICQAVRRDSIYVLNAGDPAAAGLTGKSNACWEGAQSARGTLLLFTDADTVHTTGSLSRARHELEKYDVAMLSYSPRQLTAGPLQRVLMPLIFAELAIAYPPAKVNDPASRIAAANGQFLMVESEAYFGVGGHRALGFNVLEDVALAHNIKRAKNTVRFRYAPDAVSARMYTTTAAMIEGWTKNLALLFPRPITMAMMELLVFGLAVGLPVLSLGSPFLASWQRGVIWVVWFRGLWGFFSRVSKSNFPIADRFLAILGIPLFAWLLIRSYLAVKVTKRVQWKGRTYGTQSPR